MCFLVNIFKRTFFTEHVRTTASGSMGIEQIVRAITKLR